jgi:hypothetical protein
MPARSDLIGGSCIATQRPYRKGRVHFQSQHVEIIYRVLV